jgi:hypothetical protein
MLWNTVGAKVDIQLCPSTDFRLRMDSQKPEQFKPKLSTKSAMGFAK